MKGEKWLSAAKKTMRTGLWKGFQLSLLVGYFEWVWLAQGAGEAVF